MARSLFDLAAGQGVKLTLLDIGGGFPGWDGSECVYQPMPRGEQPAGNTLDDSATTSCAPSATVSVLDVGTASTRDSGSDSGVGASATRVTQADGGATGGGEEEDASTPPPPLSLAEIARVTVPVVDELFPAGSGVQVKHAPLTWSLLEFLLLTSERWNVLK